MKKTVGRMKRGPHSPRYLVYSDSFSLPVTLESVAVESFPFLVASAFAFAASSGVFAGAAAGFAAVGFFSWAGELFFGGDESSVSVVLGASSLPEVEQQRRHISAWLCFRVYGLSLGLLFSQTLSPKP